MITTLLLEPERLRGLIAEFGRLKRLEGHTPQSRGRRLNGLIAETLRCWGIEARESERSVGEIDVAFAIDGARFLLEAKWEAGPVATDAIAKLQRRVQQRLAGVRGLFLSMSGYTPAAVSELKDGQRLEVLLLDRLHLEALLSGFSPPSELINAVVDSASYRGSAYELPVSLLSSQRRDVPPVIFGKPSGLQPLVRSSLKGVSAGPVLSELPFGQSGIAELAPSTIAVTLSAGIFSAHLDSGRLAPLLPISGCSRNTLPISSDELYVIRKHGVGRVAGGGLEIVGGGFTGSVALVRGWQSDDVWVFANSRDQSVGSPDESGALICRVGAALGDQEWHEVRYPANSGSNAAWIDQDRLLVIGSGGMRVAEPAGRARRLAVDVTNPMGLMTTPGKRVIVAADEVRLLRIDPSDESMDELAAFNLQGSVSELSPGAGGGYLFSHYSDPNRQTKGIVVAFTLGGDS